MLKTCPETANSELIHGCTAESLPLFTVSLQKLLENEIVSFDDWNSSFFDFSVLLEPALVEGNYSHKHIDAERLGPLAQACWRAWRLRGAVGAHQHELGWGRPSRA